MGEPATPIRRQIELTVAEARLRFQQLVRVTGLTGQVTVVVDGGRPIAAIVPVSEALGNGPAPPSGAFPPAVDPSASPSTSAPRSPSTSAPRSPSTSVPRSPSGPETRAEGRSGTPSSAGAEGWMRRIEKVREDVRRQHAHRIGELSQALDEAWRLLDDIRPGGTDRVVDTLRAAHADLRKAG
ncbi:hypothetical protein [Actinoplanes sp. CA-252034]|uniref:hypothetical protein n=1 Tax=Actinoplanes sp. CA-252034 TaxID=3239906 RepID=UPI003D975327